MGRCPRQGNKTGLGHDPRGMRLVGDPNEHFHTLENTDINENNIQEVESLPTKIWSLNLHISLLLVCANPWNLGLILT
jgi:hypothetical protein